MKKYIFFSILVVLFFGFLASMVYVVFDMTKGIQPNLELSQNDNDTQTWQHQSKDKEPTWQERLSGMKSKDYTPAAERFSMMFDIDTSMLHPKSKYYQLIIDKNDMYSLFCLKQTLNSYQVKYALTRTSEGTEIFLETDKQILIDDIITRLKTYEINAKFEEVWL